MAKNGDSFQLLGNSCYDVSSLGMDLGYLTTRLDEAYSYDTRISEPKIDKLKCQYLIDIIRDRLKALNDTSDLDCAEFSYLNEHLTELEKTIII